MKTEKNCLHCKNSFLAGKSNAMYCSDRCRKAMNRKNNHEAKTMVHPATIQLLTDATWDFAQNILWNGYPFSKAEIALSKLYIQQYYDEIPAEKFTATAHSHFSSYCERILLAKEYVNRATHRYIPHPCIWLNKINPKGFAGTKAWYARLVDKRRKQCYNENGCCENCSLNPVLTHYYFTA